MGVPTDAEGGLYYKGPSIGTPEYYQDLADAAAEGFTYSPDMNAESLGVDKAPWWWPLPWWNEGGKWVDRQTELISTKVGGVPQTSLTDEEVTVSTVALILKLLIVLVALVMLIYALSVISTIIKIIGGVV